MLVSCKECGLKYRISPSQIAKERARFICRGCAGDIIISKDTFCDEAEPFLGAEEKTKSELGPFFLAAEDDELLLDSQQSEIAHSPQLGGAANEDDEDGHQLLLSQRRWGGRLRLTGCFAFFLLIAGLLPVIIISLISYRQVHDMLMVQADQAGKDVVGRLVTEIDGWLEENIRVLRMAAGLSAVSSMDAWAQDEILKALQSEYPSMYLVFTTDIQGLNVARSDNRDLLDYSTHQYIREVVEGHDVALQNFISTASKKPALMIALPIKQGTQLAGVLVGAIDRSKLISKINQLNIGKGSVAFLADAQGKTIAHRNFAYITGQYDVSESPLVKTASNGRIKRVEFRDGSDDEVIGFTGVTKYGWVVAVQQKKKDILFPLVKMRNTIQILLVVVGLFLLMIAFIAGRLLGKKVDPFERSLIS